MKFRVMRLAVFTAAVGLITAPIYVHPVIALASLVCIAVGAGAAGALNMWWDSDIDLIMERTKDRPIPSGRVNKEEALTFGIILSFFSVIMLGLFSNYLSAGLLAVTIVFYVVIYSMFLKRLTPQNIVIGGAAGAFPPMIGWAVATNGISVESILMFALIFFWTPPHFWALCLLTKDDYNKAAVPMLTETHGEIVTRRQILTYSYILVIVSLLLSFTSIGGYLYFCLCIVTNFIFLRYAHNLVKVASSESLLKKKAEKKLFLFSILYLFLHFGTLLLEKVLNVFGMSPIMIPWF